jgi:hypothetical protein
VKNVIDPFITMPVASFLFLNFLISAIYLQCRSSLPIDMIGHGLSSGAVGVALPLNGILVPCCCRRPTSTWSVRAWPTAEDWARAAGTIVYEIVTRIGARVPRRFLTATDRADVWAGLAGEPALSGAVNVLA